MINKHPFHIVDRRPWPIFLSIIIPSYLWISWNSINCACTQCIQIISLYFITTALTIYCWWRDILNEGTYQGHHTYIVYKGLKIRMILFITREVMFFFRIFWAFFYFSLSPEIQIGNTWPPSGISPLNPFQLPLLNTIILLRSGITVTWAHYSIIMKNYYLSYFTLIITITLGLIFSIFQIFEFYNTEFGLINRAYGRIFFFATGFHGLHVIIGTTYLFWNSFQVINSHFNNIHHFRFEAAAWYWHFVDVVWIYLYTIVYWWFFFLINIKSIINFQLISLTSK